MKRRIGILTDWEKPLDEAEVFSYNKTAQQSKDLDGDSRLCLKGKASRRWWKPGASKAFLNITPELRILNDGTNLNENLIRRNHAVYEWDQRD